MRGFQLGKDGVVTLHALMDGQVGVFGSSVVGVWFEYNPSPDQTEKPVYVQLALSPDQAITLSRDLQKAADEAKAAPAPGTTSH